MMKPLLLPILALSLLSGCAASGPQMKSRVSEATARRAALAKVPGTVRKSEMETWKGKSYYTFDIATKSARKPVEVAVDPQTGQVVWSSNEKHR